MKITIVLGLKRSILVLGAGPPLRTGSQSHLATAALGNTDPGMAGGKELALGKLSSPPATLRWLSGKECACSAEDLGSIPGLGRALEKGMATHSSIPAWDIPWTERPGRYSPWGPKELDSTERLTLSLSPTLRFFRNNCLWCEVTDVSLNGWKHASVLHTSIKSWRTPKISYNFVNYTSVKLGDKKELLLSP